MELVRSLRVLATEQLGRWPDTDGCQWRKQAGRSTLQTGCRDGWGRVSKLILQLASTSALSVVTSEALFDKQEKDLAATLFELCLAGKFSDVYCARADVPKLHSLLFTEAWGDLLIPSDHTRTQDSNDKTHLTQEISSDSRQFVHVGSLKCILHEVCVARTLNRENWARVHIFTTAGCFNCSKKKTRMNQTWTSRYRSMYDFYWPCIAINRIDDLTVL